MQKRIEQIFSESRLAQEATVKLNSAAIVQAVQVIIRSVGNGGKILICGNGGSAADSQHMAAEFIGRFKKERKSIPAVALTTDTSALTALGNDYGFDKVFVRQVEGLGRRGDVLIAISTSGNSVNVIEAVKLAKTLGIMTISLTGNKGGQLKDMSDININVPVNMTARVQESHCCVIHTICELVEDSLAQILKFLKDTLCTLPVKSSASKNCCHS